MFQLLSIDWNNAAATIQRMDGILKSKLQKVPTAAFLAYETYFKKLIDEEKTRRGL